jgi:hypothetical protein
MDLITKALSNLVRCHSFYAVLLVQMCRYADHKMKGLQGYIPQGEIEMSFKSAFLSAFSLEQVKAVLEKECPRSEIGDLSRSLS